MATVNLIDVNKSYGSSEVLHHVDLAIEQGEFVAVVGPSGCGKSTLLRLVAGLDSISSGRILINNQCVNKIPPAQRDMAMVFQNYALYPHMTVFDNMAYGLKMRGMEKKCIKQRVEKVSAMLQLTDYLQRKPLELSGGQCQRVAMGRAIVRSPAVFLFDEPLSNLDAKLRSEMRHEIKKLHKELNTTCLYVTHDQTEAMTMADRVVVLNKGKIEQIGVPQALYKRPASLFVAGFTGHYPMNFLPAKIDLSLKRIILDVGLILPLPQTDFNLPDKKEVILGIRPEHLEITTRSENSISVTIEFIDDMGADKLVHGFVQNSHTPIAIRIPADNVFSENSVFIKPILKHANLYCSLNGEHIGDWNG